MTSFRQPNSIYNLFTLGQPLHFPKGEVVLGNEPEPNGVYYLDSGYIKVYSIGADGSEFIHIIFGHGDLFPLSWAYLGGETSVVYYETISGCTMWRLSRYWFNKIARGNPKISYDLSKQMAQQYRIYSYRLDNLEYKKAIERVSYRLLLLANRFGEKEEGHITIKAPVTHELFARSINLARESASREIEKLEIQGVITSHNHRFQITDLEALGRQLNMPLSFDTWQPFYEEPLSIS